MSVVAPMWTPGREDLLLELCGEIEDEDKSLVERAEEHSERFTEYSKSRTEDADRAQKGVAAIADGIPFGQPILIGHHSEKRARRDVSIFDGGAGFSDKRKILILGATGVVGRETLRRALNNPRIGQIVAPTRRALGSHTKLVNPIAPELDLLLHDAAVWRVDAVICAMATTIGKAGSKEAFRHIDYELPIAFGRPAHLQGAEAFVLVSSPGASLSIPLFYNRTKGEVESDVTSIGFNSLTIVRPGPSVVTAKSSGLQSVWCCRY